MWNAAQDFKSARPDLLRFGMIATLIGSTFGFNTLLEDPLPKIGAAVLVATPAGQRQLLRGLSGLGRGAAAAAKTIPRTATGAKRVQTKELLNALISTAARQQPPQRQ